jgi:hypothetical protein
MACLDATQNSNEFDSTHMLCWPKPIRSDVAEAYIEADELIIEARGNRGFYRDGVPVRLKTEYQSRDAVTPGNA